jgi:glycosyltransferase involved in cell wall biosynthesis
MTERHEGPPWREIGVIGLMPDAWGDRWMVRTHVMTRLGRYFNVLWMNPACHWRETWRTRTASRRYETAVLPGFSVYSPEPWLPALYRPAWLANFSFCQRLRRARRLLESRGSQRIVLYLWAPRFASALSCIRHDLSCYHLEDEYSYSAVELPVDPVESRLLAAVDLPFMLSPALYEKKRSLNPAASFVPGGVDFAAYQRSRPEPADLARVPRPRIGYSGAIKKQLDWALLDYLITRHRDCSFVFLGPQNPHEGIDEAVRVLAGRPNVHFLGPKTPTEIPSYPQHFDVCIMPYTNDGYTKFIYPLKLHEYLAAGRPTIGTPIRSLVDFAEVVALPRTFEEWSVAIAMGLTPAANTPERCAARRAVARRFDWDDVVRGIADKIARRLGTALDEFGEG